MSYGVNSIQIHKKLRLDKRAGSDNWYARLTLYREHTEDDDEPELVEK